MKKRHESAGEWQALLAKKDDEIASLNRQVEWLTQQLRLMQGRRADETTLMVRREPGRKAQQKSWVWVYRTSGDAENPVVLYDYQPSRAGECASRFLEGFTGLLHTDGYGAYHCKLPPQP